MDVKEGCSCGAWVHGARRDVLNWREQHVCPDRPSDPDQVAAGAQVELAATVPIGFHIQPTNAPDPYEGDDEGDD